MKKLLLNLYLWPAFILITLFGIIMLPAIFLVNAIFFGRGPARALRIAIRFYGWILVCIVPFMAPVKVEGALADIPKPSIFVANHNSAIDPYLFGAIPVENCFVTSWPFKIPVYGPLMRLAGYVNIADGWDNILQKCIQMLSDGVSIAIWPEGHRSRNGRMGRFRRGAFQLAVESGYPIQPVCIIGSGKVMYPGERLLSPGRVKLVLLDPIYPETDYSDKQNAIQSLRMQTIKALQDCLDLNNSWQYQTYRPHGSNTSLRSNTIGQHPHDIR